jgi:hypothetical protein
MIVKIALESSQDTRWIALLLASDDGELDAPPEQLAAEEN